MKDTTIYQSVHITNLRIIFDSAFFLISRQHIFILPKLLDCLFFFTGLQEALSTFNLNYYKSFLKLAVCRLDPLINFPSLRKMDVNDLNFKSEHAFSLLKVFQQLHTSYKIESQLLNFVQSTYNLVCLYASYTSHYISLLKVLSVEEKEKRKSLIVPLWRFRYFPIRSWLFIENNC